MSVLERFPEPLAPEVRLRGERFAAEGKVDLYIGRDNSVRASVFDDGRKFETELAWDNGSPFSMSCGCAAFDRQGVCGHLVATALEAEREGYLPPPSHASRETRPRRGDRGPIFLTSTGKIRRLDEEEEPRPVIAHQPSLPSWKKTLARVKEQASRHDGVSAPENWPPDRAILYVIDVPASLDAAALVIRLAARDRKASGDWSRPKTRGILFPDVSALADPIDQQILSLLRAGNGAPPPGAAFDPAFKVPDGLLKLLVPQICRTGRALIWAEADSEEMRPLRWDDGPPWEFWLEGLKDQTAEQFVLSGWLRRRRDDQSEEKIPVTRPLLVLAGGVLFFPDAAATLDDSSAFPWLMQLRGQRTVHVPFAQSGELLTEILSMPHLPRLDLPDELKVETLSAAPRPALRIRAPGPDEFRPDRLRAELSFDYDGTVVRYAEGHAPRNTFDPARRRMVVRDAAAERKAFDRLNLLGLRDARDYSRGGTELWFSQRHLTRVIRALVNEGWHVEADGRLYRAQGQVRLNVSSGIDWFELRGEVDFGGGRHVPLPDVLAALRKGETTVRLDDGSVGMLPEAWLKKYGLIASIGHADGDLVRFSKTQVGILDALLAGQPQATWDEGFDTVRRELRRFEGVAAEQPPEGFTGQLRPYQQEGLGWFSFLRRFGFGGCLADDMGLGKTVQVLALLAARSNGSAGSASTDRSRAPSLVVLPKSLVFNWQQEAQRFTPALRVLDHTGIDRVKSSGHLADYDVILTTYGTLRRDAMFLKDVEFDYVILDEAQAVKNPSSESAKAVRLVKGRHRLALSGTPVQNHLGDLWSLFDFLNPGMLGNASVLADASAAARGPDDGSRQLLARALRPFILRRTKEQVASDLPPKVEQTIYCELDAAQRKVYDDLREYYRRSLLEQVDRDGLNRSKLQILEALLRLRQAALHPGLLDSARAAEGSAKLDMLIPRLQEVIEEGHKALVFSQFTSMLALVRTRLDAAGLAYEYLDGKTRDREARVNRFQSDPHCKLFLISLKAGGLGLNLTAADYVFLLDPWWNPAVEAQAIDRAHRIGQDKQVFACRLIAKDTVEEKVLALQKTKRDLADAIINADNSLIRSLGRDDLELLLS